jgi:urease accessory protein UreE
MQHRVIGAELRVERTGHISPMQIQPGMPGNEVRYGLGNRHLTAFIEYELFCVQAANLPQDAVILDFDLQHPLLRLRHDIPQPTPVSVVNPRHK